jgi:hypothetical protein
LHHAGNKRRNCEPAHGRGRFRRCRLHETRPPKLYRAENGKTERESLMLAASARHKNRNLATYTRKTHMTKQAELIALEDSSLETVAGGFDYKKPSFDLDLDLNLNLATVTQTNTVVFAGNTIVAEGGSNYIDASATNYSDIHQDA